MTEPQAWTDERLAEAIRNILDDVQEHPDEVSLGYASDRIIEFLQSDPSIGEYLRGGWRPIETAPKDGSSFLASSQGWATVCSWHRTARSWCAVGPVYSGYAADEQPDHWQPLPPRGPGDQP